MEFVREKKKIMIFDDSKLHQGELYDITLFDKGHGLFSHRYCRFLRCVNDNTEIVLKLEYPNERTLGQIEITNTSFTKIRVAPSPGSVDEIPGIMKEKTIYEWIDGVFEKGEPYHIQRFAENGKLIENSIGLYRLTEVDRIVFVTMDSHGRPSLESVWRDRVEEYKITPFQIKEEDLK